MERIVSFLPSGTEIAYALGLGGRVVGVSHECDYPAESREKPVVVRGAMVLDGLTPAETDVAVSTRLRGGGTLYEVDELLLQRLAPDLIITQDLCQVCAPSGNETTRALEALARRPDIVWLTPRTLADINANIRDVARAAGCIAAAEALIARNSARIERVGHLVRGATPPRVFFVEWTDPVYCGGHWVPEMIELAGGVDRVGRRGSDSVRVAVTEVVDWAPEVLVVSPCGFAADAALEQARELVARPEWKELPAARAGRVYAVNASAFFARPGPRVVEGIELLAHLFHPALVEWQGSVDAWRIVT